MPAPNLERLEALLEGLALLVAVDPLCIPAFDRLDREIRALKANDPISRARSIVAERQAQRAMA